MGQGNGGPEAGGVIGGCEAVGGEESTLCSPPHSNPV